MLFIAAAIFYSWAHVLGMAGATTTPAITTPATMSIESTVAAVAVTPENTVHLATSRLDGVSSTPPEPRLEAPDEGVPVVTEPLAACGAVHGRASTRTVHPAACLDELTDASRPRLDRFARSLDRNQGSDVAFATTLGARGSAAATSSWWAELSSPQRTELVRAVPGVVGNLEGVPYASRDLANRVELASTISSLEERESRAAAGYAIQDGDVTRRLVMLQQVQLALTPGTEGDDAPRNLISLDTAFPGRAAVSVGDLDTADEVSLMVPGMLYTVSNQIVFWTNRAADLHSEQSFWSSTLATSASGAPGSTATVAWMGYRTPNLTNVLGLGLAKVGAVHLEDTVEGLDAARAEHEPRVTVIAHSYGSTAATIALSSGRIHADSFVVLGSPGSVVPEASDLAVTHGQVFAAAAALDPVAGSGVFGEDPGATAFGATLLSVAGGVDPYTAQHLSATFTHNSYFVPGSRSMRNLALVAIGRGGVAGGRAPVKDPPQQPNGPALALLRPQDVTREAVA